jgi:hypothetical protein
MYSSGKQWRSDTMAVVNAYPGRNTIRNTDLPPDGYRMTG